MDKVCDVVVVGYGGAGAAAAITAYDNGASVIVLEKMPHGGGNSRVCGGGINIPKSKDFSTYLKALSYNLTENEIIDTYVDYAMKLETWVKELGGTVVPFLPLEVHYPGGIAGPSFPQVPGSQYMAKYNVTGNMSVGASQRLWDFLSSNVERRKIEVLYNTPAKELVKNQKGEVAGVIAEIDGKRALIRTKKAVILTCGGFENNAAMKRDYLPVKDSLFLGNPGNTGDGITMVQKIGGTLWHMTALSCSIGMKVPGFEAAFFISFLSPRFIIVDKYGKRYFSETGIEGHEYWRPFSDFDTNSLEYSHMPSYAIFDDEIRKMGSIATGTSGYNRDKYTWSDDNSAEITKGWIVKGKTIAELADKLSIDKSVLEKTVTRYNKCCQEGSDPGFNRRSQELKPLSAPYYAVEIWPALANTQGGPRRDKEARVLNPDGEPIPGLYAAGELGSIWGFLYQGSTNISECLVFGQIAGKNAAKGNEVQL